MIDTDMQGVTVRWPEGGRSFYHYIWLRNCCYCEVCGSTYTGERFLQPSDVAENIQALRVKTKDSELVEITWDDGHLSVYELSWLKRHDYSDDERKRKNHYAKLWGQSISLELPKHDYVECISDDSSYLDLLRDIRDFGFSIVTNCPTENGIETTAALIGDMADAAYSKVFDLKPDEKFSLGNTFHPVAPHTDEAYLHTPTGILVLYCISPANDGGETILVDGFNIANKLKHKNPDDFELLNKQPQTFHRVVPEHGVYQSTRAKVLVTDEDDNVLGVRFHTRTMAPMDVSTEKLKAVHLANAAMSRLMLDPTNQARLKLGAREAVIFDNHRVMHSRTGFSDPARFLQIGNVSRENFHQRLRFTAHKLGFEFEANQVLSSGAVG